MKVYSHSHIGYRHTREGTEMQDSSSSFIGNDREIVACCDGHGGKVYIRSKIGSSFACQAVIDGLNKLRPEDVSGEVITEEELIYKVKLNILVAWNNLVELHLEGHPFTDDELSILNEKEKQKIIDNPVTAYGTTLLGAMRYRDKFIVIQLGDGASFVFGKSGLKMLFEDEDADAVANSTYSMCGEDVFDHMHVSIHQSADLVGVLLCTDGLINPYQTKKSFASKFIIPVLLYAQIGDMERIDQSVDTIGSKTGYGDDVSLSFLFKNFRMEILGKL